MRATEKLPGLLLAIMLGVSCLGSLPSPVRADTAPIDLVLGGTGAIQWALENIQPGDSGTESVELHNTGSKDGYVTIWVSDITSLEGINPEPETGDTAEPGELNDYILFDITADKLITDMDMPAKISDFPQSYSSNNSIEVIPIKSGETVTVDWIWELPAETGNDVQGDTLQFEINYFLRECHVADLTGITGPDGTLTEGATTESDTSKSRITINQGTVCKDKDGQPLDEIWLINVDKPPQAEPPDNVIISLWKAGPEGATFDPAITLTIAYDQSDIPSGVNEKDLNIALWDEDAGEWVILENPVIDTYNNTISIQISHFSSYALIVDPTPATVPGSTGIGGHTEPTEPSSPADESPAVYLDVDMLGKQETVETAIDGTLTEPLTLSDAEGKVLIELESGSRIVSSNSTPLERLELTIVEESVATLTDTDLPENIVLLSPIYRLTGYIGDTEVSPVYFEPAAILTIEYETADLAGSILTPFISYLESGEEITPPETTTSLLAEADKAKLQTDQASLFVVAAELVPPPPPLPAEFVLSDLTISPQSSSPGETITISVDIANNGESSDSHELYLQIDGVIKAIKKVVLEPEGSLEVTFEVSGLAGGIHRVKIGDLTGQLEITTAETLPVAPDVNWLLLDICIGSGVFIGLVTLYILRKRARRTQNGTEQKPVNTSGER